MIYRHTEEQINEYKQSLSVNQSSLKALLNEGIQSFARNYQNLVQEEDKLYYEEKDWAIIGSAVDDYITMGEEYYKLKYHISQLEKKPFPSVMSVIKHSFDVLSLSNNEINRNLSDYKRQLWESCNANNFYNNNAKSFEEDNRVQNRILKDECSQMYWGELIDSVGKQILSDQEKQVIESIISTLTVHRHTSFLFKEVEGVDTIFQMPLYFKVSKTDCKILPDIIRVNHKTATISIFDIKTMAEDVLTFKHQLKRRRYDIQGSFYLYGIKKSLALISKLLGIDVTGYNVASFAFVVESKQSYGIPMIFTMSSRLIKHGQYGSSFEQRQQGKRYLGWAQAIDVFEAWTDNEWQLEKVLGEIKGIIEINDDFEYENTSFLL